MEEVWKPVLGYESYYEVSNLGNVRSIDRIITSKLNYKLHYKSKLLKPAKDRAGYLKVALCFDCNLNTYFVHSLVAKAFIPNPDNKPTVNHIDGNKLNNYISNLEWATKSEQSIHALKYELKKMPNVWKGKFGEKHGASKPIIQYDINNNFIAEYGSIIDASKKLNILASGISGVCRGLKKSAGGYYWRFK